MSYCMCQGEFVVACDDLAVRYLEGIYCSIYAAFSLQTESKRECVYVMNF